MYIANKKFFGAS